MKSKHHFHRSPFIILSIPFLLLSPAMQAQDQTKDKIADEVVKAEETVEEAAQRVKEAAKRAEKRVEEAAERTKEKAERVAKRTQEALEREKAKAERAIERTKEDAEREKEKAEQEKAIAEKKAQQEKEAAEKKAQQEKAVAEKKAQQEKEAAEKKAQQEKAVAEKKAAAALKAAANEKSPEVVPPPTDKSGLPPESRNPRKDKKPHDGQATPAKDGTTKLIPVEPVKREVVEPPVTEPERLAETKVTEVTREVERDLDQRKNRIGDRKEAQALINDIIGAESRISRAEMDRQERFQPRFDRQYTGEYRPREASPDQRRAATTYYQERLRGHEVEGPPPEFFRHSQYRDDRRDPRDDRRNFDRVEYVRPRYLNDGRRYVHYDSRASIPAILMAALAMNQVRFQPTREVAPMFYEGRDPSFTQGMPLPPENYRSDNSWVVSYPVDEKSMISSEDILFLQGTTQFSDPYSYEVIGVMADAMKAMPDEERFVIEGHASAEGSYESNMILSQQRAEHIVRQIVRQGVSPYRLLPVGYGESEARRAENATEYLRSQDRRVVVFRMKSESVAQR